MIKINEKLLTLSLIIIVLFLFFIGKFIIDNYIEKGKLITTKEVTAYIDGYYNSPIKIPAGDTLALFKKSDNIDEKDGIPRYYVKLKNGKRATIDQLESINDINKH
jgi:hypothetical protein